jgi:hypothetical protein
MEENAKTIPVPTGRWLALIVAAVVLAEGIWAMLVSVTRSLILPLVARLTGGDPQSALYLGKGEVNVPDLFGSVLQICLAAIVFLIIKSWPSKGSGVKTPRLVKTSKPMPSLSVAPQPVAKPATPTAQAAVASAGSAAQPQAQAASSSEVAQRTAQPKSAALPEPAQPSPQPKPAAKPAKPKKPQEVYYNIVGEPISPEDE